MSGARHFNTKHGMSDSPEWKSWRAMKARCENPNNPAYHRYGGRGIRICERWKSFENFVADMGLRPTSLHTIERIDNDGNYELVNCRWATYKEQNWNRSNNRTITLNGETKTFGAWSEFTGIPIGIIQQRVEAGWPAERVLVAGKYKPKCARPDHCRNGPIEFEGRSLTLTEWSKDTGIGRTTLIYRITNGWSVGEVLTRPVGLNGRKHDPQKRAA